MARSAGRTILWGALRPRSLGWEGVFPLTSNL